jgi:carboxymethylenebutenolidase
VKGKAMSEPIRISQEMIRLYDEYTHVTLDRRDFMNKLARLTGSAAAAAAIVPLIEANQARAAIIAEDDPRLATETVTYAGSSGELTGYLARPAEASGKLPAVIVIHENRGLNAHIKDVVRRMALEGFLALGPDFLAPAGGTPADEDQARDMIGKLDPARTVTDAVATVAYLKEHPSSNGNVGAVGFCWGGGLANQLAVHAPDLAAGVAYYGRVPEAADVPKIKARMLLHYAGLDERINQGIPAYRKALEEAGIDHQIHIYEGANHAFNNDTSEARYNKEAAELAWSRTVEFLKGALA